MRGFKRAMNMVPAMILRSPLHRLISKSVLLLTFTGRKSGKTYTTPITYVSQGDTYLMTTDSPWWKNLRGEAGAATPVILRIEGQEHATYGEAVTNEAEVARVMEIFTRKFPRYGKYAGMEVDPEGRVTPARSRRPLASASSCGPG